MPPLRIEVTGESTIYRPAERCVLSIGVESTSTLSQQEASKDVFSTAANLREMLEPMSVKDAAGQPLENAPISRWSSSSLSTGSYQPYDNEGNPKSCNYTALVTFQVRFKDFSKLGAFTTTLAEMKHVKINNVDWRLTDKTKESLSSQSRYQAVQDAVKKGGDYSTALGAGSLPVVEIRDNGGQSTHLYSARNVQGMMAAGGIEEMRFEPENVAINCSIMVVLEQK